MLSVQEAANLSTINYQYKASNFFIQLFYISTLCMQSIRHQQEKKHHLRTQSPDEEDIFEMKYS